ncbi:MAG: Rieske 2Fe-2S domain-containing protein [Caldilineaceae bacterium]
MAESVVEHAHAEDVVTEAEAIANSAAEALEASVDTAHTNGHAPSYNGSSPAVAPAAEAVIVPELTPEEIARRQMNRREFLTYTWVGALLVVTGVSGFAMFEFLYPRFKAGQFGGKFTKTQADFGDVTKAPKGDSDGRFWMVTTTEGKPKAIYMVCTHLGCLYKWSDTNHRFECPCHGSKFSHDGFYIEGPAPRSLDYFAVTEQNGQITVDTGKKQKGDPSGDSPAKGAPIGTV